MHHLNKLTLALLALLAVACNQPNKEKSTKIIVAGKIEGTEAEKIMLRDAKYLIVAENKISPDGTFSLDFEHKAASMYYLTDGKNYETIFLKPGDSLHITTESEKFQEAMKFGGSDVAEQNQILKKVNAGFDDFDIGSPEIFFSKEPDSFLAELKKIEQALTNKVDSLTKDDKFNKTLKAEVTYELARKQIMYNSYHPYYAKLDSFKLPEGFKESALSLPKNDPDLLTSIAFRSYLQDYVSDKAVEAYQANSEKYDTIPNSWTTLQFEIVNKMELNDTLHQEMIGALLYDAISYEGVDGIKSEYTSFMQGADSSYFTNYLQEQYEKWLTLSKGNEAPAFTGTTVEGDSVTLADLAGKYVYIDVWATWCGPCIAEQPHWEKLVENFEGKPVTFVSISIDDSAEPWKKMLSKKEMKGMQLYAGGDWDSELATSYLVKSIPRFILINPEGKIENAQAPRPSGPIAEELDKLLSKT